MLLDATSWCCSPSHPSHQTFIHKALLVLSHRPALPPSNLSLSLQHHAATQALDAVKGRPVSDPKLVEALLYAADLASWSYCPTKEVREEE